MRGLAVSSVPAVIEPPEEILPAPGVWEPPSDTSSRVALALSQDAFPGPPCQDLDKALIASVTDPIPRPVPQVQQSPLLSGKGKIFSTYVVVGNGDFPWRHSHWVLHVCQSIRPLRSRLTLLRICATNFCSALLLQDWYGSPLHARLLWPALWAQPRLTVRGLGWARSCWNNALLCFWQYSNPVDMCVSANRHMRTPGNFLWCSTSCWKFRQLVLWCIVRIGNGPPTSPMLSFCSPEALAGRVLSALCALQEPTGREEMSLQHPEQGLRCSGFDNLLGGLRKSWVSFLLDCRMPSRLREHIRAKGEGSFFSLQEVTELRSRFQASASSTVAPKTSTGRYLRDSLTACLHLEA